MKNMFIKRILPFLFLFTAIICSLSACGKKEPPAPKVTGIYESLLPDGSFAYLTLDDAQNKNTYKTNITGMEVGGAYTASDLEIVLIMTVLGQEQKLTGAISEDKNSITFGEITLVKTDALSSSQLFNLNNQDRQYLMGMGYGFERVSPGHFKRNAVRARKNP